MQLPILSTSPTIAAKESPDKWRKLSIEAAQMLANAYTHEELMFAPKTTTGKVRSNKCHPHHPLSKWTVESLDNWLWTLEYGVANIYEALYRGTYKKEPHHLKFLEWCLENWPDLPDVGLTPFVKMKGYEHLPVEESYQAYFNDNKQHLAKWTNRETPEWYKSNIA